MKNGVVVFLSLVVGVFAVDFAKADDEAQFIIKYKNLYWQTISGFFHMRTSNNVVTTYETNVANRINRSVT